MGRRGLKMGIRGKPGILLVCLLGLVIIITIYYSQSSSSSRNTNNYEYKKSFNMGSNRNFDPLKFVRDKNPSSKDKLSHVRQKQQTDLHNFPNLNSQNENSNVGKVSNDDDYKWAQRNAFPSDQKNKNEPSSEINIEEKGIEQDLHPRIELPNNPIRNNFVNRNVNQQAEKGMFDTKNRTNVDNFVGMVTASQDELSKLYKKPDPKQSLKFKSMEHIVHLDLKGAAPKMEYLIRLLPMLKSMGTTGILVEYEDMFPYDGDLSQLSATNAFTKSQMSQLLKITKNQNLQIIPLLPTFGHMEFVLKHQKFAHLRESYETPQVITPALNESYSLLEMMIDQIVRSHPASQFIHLGCDEVYNLGKGQSATYMENMGYDQSQLFFEHVSRLVRYIKRKYPNLTTLIWDDEFRHSPLETIQKFGMGGVLEPMIWSYTPNPRDKFSDDIWEKYGKSFKNVWAASSFKGATGSTQYFTNITHHLSNHLGWIDVINEAREVAPSMNFRGIAMTGWQRYDHFATLCELLPSALPSLSVCLSAIVNGGFTEVELQNVKVSLECSDNSLTDCSFPGSDLYKLILKFKKLENRVESNQPMKQRLEGWLNSYNIKYGFSSPGQLNVLNKYLNKTIFNYTEIKKDLNSAILNYYDEPTADEWITVHIDQKIQYFNEKLVTSKSLMNQKVWPRRPLKPTEGLNQVRQNANLNNKFHPQNANLNNNFRPQNANLNNNFRPQNANLNNNFHPQNANLNNNFRQQNANLNNNILWKNSALRSKSVGTQTNNIINYNSQTQQGQNGRINKINSDNLPENNKFKNIEFNPNRQKQNPLNLVPTDGIKAFRGPQIGKGTEQAQSPLTNQFQSEKFAQHGKEAVRNRKSRFSREVI